jgi:hypothetical protein
MAAWTVPTSLGPVPVVGWTVPTFLGPVPVVALPLLAGAEAAGKLAAAAWRRSTLRRFLVLLSMHAAWSASGPTAAALADGTLVVPQANYSACVLAVLLAFGASRFVASGVVARRSGQDGPCLNSDHGESMQQERALVLCLSQVRWAQTQCTIPELDAELLRHIIELTTEAEHANVAACGHDCHFSCSGLLLDPIFICIPMLMPALIGVVGVIIGVVPVACCGAVALAVELMNASS